MEDFQTLIFCIIGGLVGVLIGVVIERLVTYSTDTSLSNETKVLRLLREDSNKIRLEFDKLKKIIPTNEHIKEEALKFNVWININGYDYSDCSPDVMWNAYQKSKLK